MQLTKWRLFCVHSFIHFQIFNNFWMRLSGISRIIEAEVDVRLRRITLTDASIILDIPRKLNSIIILLFTWNYSSFILSTNYSLELFTFILCVKRKNRIANFTNYYSQARPMPRMPRFICRCDVIITNNKNYHSLYNILEFDWLIHLRITACKYRSAANNWCKYCIEHAYFENASSASIKKISFFLNVNMARFAELPECELSTILGENDAKNTKKATKVTLNIFRGYLQEKGLREAEFLT